MTQIAFSSLDGARGVRSRSRVWMFLVPGVALCVLVALFASGASRAVWHDGQAGAAIAGALSGSLVESAVLVPAMAIAAVLGAAFILTRARLLVIAAKGTTERDGGISTSNALRTRDGARAFVEGTCIECVTWPGKVWADAYRTSLLRAEGFGWKSAATALVRFRIATMLGAACMLLLASAIGSAWHAGITLVAAGSMILVASQRMRTQAKAGGSGRASLASLSAWGALGSLLDVASAAMVVWMITGVSPLEFAPLYVLVTLVASASTLPLGVGIAEVGGWWVLTKMLGVDAGAAAMAVATYRIAGPGLTLLLGAASLAGRCARGVTSFASMRRSVIEAMQARETAAGDEQTQQVASTVESKRASIGRPAAIEDAPVPAGKVEVTLIESKHAQVQGSAAA